jgi:hypothetical protein
MFLASGNEVSECQQFIYGIYAILSIFAYGIVWESVVRMTRVTPMLRLGAFGEAR